jgi:hypothetical protein
MIGIWLDSIYSILFYYFVHLWENRHNDRLMVFILINGVWTVFSQKYVRTDEISICLILFKKYLVENFVQFLMFFKNRTEPNRLIDFKTLCFSSNIFIMCISYYHSIISFRCIPFYYFKLSFFHTNYFMFFIFQTS